MFTAPACNVTCQRTRLLLELSNHSVFYDTMVCFERRRLEDVYNTIVQHLFLCGNTVYCVFSSRLGNVANYLESHEVTQECREKSFLKSYSMFLVQHFVKNDLS